ncbi:MAG: sulfatase-like hydrolase/transferase [Saprospiraceae bacterium]|nr:sulfatase-like hydrolase/transferase [Saprospiraceae bacterium]
MSYFGPHLPVAPPKPWDTLFSLAEINLPPNFHDDLKDKPKRQKEISAGYFQSPWNQDQYKDYIRRYWGYCGYIDQEIGRIFNSLKKSGQWENTFIVFTSDHGDMLTAHGMIFKLGSNGYEELFRVPAIFKIPGIKGVGSEYSALTSSIDILPTILHAAQIQAHQGIDGENLLPIFNHQQSSVRDFVFSEIHSTGQDGKTIICRNMQFKYVYHWLSQDVDELYDLTKDPGELINLISDAQHRETVQLMQNKIIQWSRETNHHYADLISKKASL